MSEKRKRINIELHDCPTPPVESYSVFKKRRQDSAKPTTETSSDEKSDGITATNDAVVSQGELHSTSSKSPTASSRDEVTSCEAEETAVEGGASVGKNFAETFSYLKNTKHYEEPKPSETSTKQDHLPKANPNAILVNPRQRGNPILKHVRNVPLEFRDIVPDYVVGATSCVLFLSLRYHSLNPDYIHERLKKLGGMYELRILLVQVDTKDPHHNLKQLSKICILASCTLILAWSAEEAGRYLETYKSYENKPPDLIQERTDNDYVSQMTDCLTTVKSVNKTNVTTLMSTFGTLKDIADAGAAEIALCPGFGPQKAKRLVAVFNEPFVKKLKATAAGPSSSSSAAAITIPTSKES